MFLKILYNISLILGGGFSFGYTSVVVHNFINKNSKYHPIYFNGSKLDNITNVFNTGFYVGAACSVMYLVTGKPLFCNFIEC